MRGGGVNNIIFFVRWEEALDEKKEEMFTAERQGHHLVLALNIREKKELFFEMREKRDEESGGWLSCHVAFILSTTSLTTLPRKLYTHTHLPNLVK